MRGEKLTLQATVDGAEALHQLRQNTSTNWYLPYCRGKDFVSSIDGNEFELWRGRYWMRNDFAPHFFGRVIPQAGACRIEGHFDTGSWVRGFMKVCIPIATVVCLIVLVATARRGKAEWPLYLLPFAAPVWGIAMPRMGYFFGLDDEDEILRFLEKMTGAVAGPREKQR